MNRVEDFVRYREHLVRVAYGLLGSIDEAEDVVQDALVRAGRAVPEEITHPRAWLTKVVTNAALDQLKSARVRRESYVGPWLPEPVIGPPWGGDQGVDPIDRVTLDEQISLALLTVLETLSPAERAVYVLHEAFGLPLTEVAAIVGRTHAACRQLATRARRHLRARAPRFSPDRVQQERVVAAFQAAAQTGDIDALAHLLDDSVVLRTDGGGVVAAAARPIEGRARVIGALRGGLRSTSRLKLDRRVVNGDPGLIMTHDRGTAVVAFAVRDGHIVQIDVIANPEKLRNLPR